jgi:cell division protein FtsZ
VHAAEGIDRLKDVVDALIVIPNDKLLSISDRRTPLSDAFKLADNVLHQAVQGVTDLILRPGLVNVDFADVRTIMSNAGSAIMGIGEGYGENRVATAAHNAINSPLMETPMIGAKGVLFNVSGGANIGIHEVEEAAEIINNASDEEAFIIWGHVYDPEMDDAVKITVIATGFDEAAPPKAAAVGGTKILSAPSKVVVSGPQAPQPVSPQQSAPAAPVPTRTKDLGEADVRLSGLDSSDDLFRTSGVPTNQLDIPAYLRKKK